MTTQTAHQAEMTRLVAISAAVYREHGPAERALQAKCRHEEMSRTAVIAEWGDPRTWRDE